jgi:hypothetical protein
MSQIYPRLRGICATWSWFDYNNSDFISLTDTVGLRNRRARTQLANKLSRNLFVFLPSVGDAKAPVRARSGPRTLRVTSAFGYRPPAAWFSGQRTLSMIFDRLSRRAPQWSASLTASTARNHAPPSVRQRDLPNRNRASLRLGDNRSECSRA